MPPVTTSKMGLDATIPIGRDRRSFERCHPAAYRPDAPHRYASLSAEQLEAGMLELITREGACYFRQILDEFNGVGHRAVLEAFGRLRERNLLGRDDSGRYVRAALVAPAAGLA